MEQQVSLEKKVVQKAYVGPAKIQDCAISTDGYKRNGAQYPRKREFDKVENVRNPPHGNGGRKGQRYVRPREKACVQVKLGDDDYQSLYPGNRKKQNITHLLNWWAHERRPFRPWLGDVQRGRRHGVYHPKYKKEHFIQANCQFVVLEGHDCSPYSVDPDKVIDWDLVEEVHLHVPSEPVCPICLQVPTAAKVTRCGHIYCFPCMLHYLALSDEKFRTCPICYEMVQKSDLKSVITVQLKDFSAGEEIEFQLMCRSAGCLVPYPVTDGSDSKPDARMPRSLHDKFLVIPRSEVVRTVLCREIRELELLLEEEGDQPEACFIQEALRLVSTRESDLLNFIRELEGLTIDCATTDADASCGGSEMQEDKRASAASSDETVGQMQSRMSAAVKDIVGKTAEEGKGNVFFYQARNGSHTYLHSINVQMFIREYGSMDVCPHTFKSVILEKESCSVTEELRHKMKCLGHLPVTCPFDLVEVELCPPLMSQLTVEEFHDGLEKRRKNRLRKAKEEKKIAHKVKVEEDRLLGRSRGARVNMASLKHFPVFHEKPPSEWTENPSVAEACGSSPIDIPTTPADTGVSVSFAQMTKDGVKSPLSSKVCQSWPEVSPSSKSSQGPLSGRGCPCVPATSCRASGLLNNSDDSDTEGFPVPDYKSAFSDAISLAFDRAAQQHADAVAGCADSRRKSKKGRKKVVLCSSGAALR